MVGVCLLVFFSFLSFFFLMAAQTVPNVSWKFFGSCRASCRSHGKVNLQLVSSSLKRCLVLWVTTDKKISAGVAARSVSVFGKKKLKKFEKECI